MVKSLIQNLKAKCSVTSGRTVAHKNTQFFSHDDLNKLFERMFYE